MRHNYVGIYSIVIFYSDKAFFEGIAIAMAEKNNEVWVKKSIEDVLR